MYPTSYPDVNALLQTLLSGVQAILASEFIGMYIHGSLAAGDFDPARSDIDFLVVTGNELSDGMTSDLAALHAAIAAGGLGWKTNYEGSYIPQHALRRYDPAHCLHPAVRVDGSFGIDRHGSEWVIQRHIIRTHGIRLAGPPPATLIDPIAPADLQLATCRLLQEWWAPQLDEPFRLRDSEYQAYAVLTMCRALYTLKTGAIATKPQAARWAEQNLDPTLGGLIRTAAQWRHGVELDRFAEVLDFVRQTVRLAEHLGRG